MKYMAQNTQDGLASALEVSPETHSEEAAAPFDFSEAAVVVMLRVPELGREMWRALLRGEAGEENKGYAAVRLQNLFWDMVDGATLGDSRSIGLMVEELIMEFKPDYKKHMGLPDRPGLELDHVLPKSMYEVLSSNERPRSQ